MDVKEREIVTHSDKSPQELFGPWLKKSTGDILDGASLELLALVRQLVENEPLVAEYLPFNKITVCCCIYAECNDSVWDGDPAEFEHASTCPWRCLKEALEAHE